MASERILVNRAPVLALWASVVAESLGYDRDAALSLGQAVSALNAQAKGRRLGIYGPPKEAPSAAPPKAPPREEVFWVSLCSRPVPARATAEGIRAVIKGEVVGPQRVQAYLQSKLGLHLEGVRRALQELAASLSPEELTEQAYSLYERFRPAIPAGRRGWGVAGELDLELIRSLQRRG
jgi:hypothetical protein